jgi:mannose-6-phosphate isomerase
LLVKILDARERLSLQVHPPEKIAAKVGGEPKTEFWYVAAADPSAELFVGLREAMTRGRFEEALRSGTVAKYVHRIRVQTGDAMFLPAGRLHAVGEGNLLVEIQQNSDTTYRVFDWNRVDDQGKPRQLHVDQALQCIDFNDIRPRLVQTEAEVLLHHDLFEIQKWNLDSPRQIAPLGQFAVVYCLTGKLRCADVELRPGESFLIPARLQDRSVGSVKKATSLLRITIPNQT